jgi:hypothetical protein
MQRRLSWIMIYMIIYKKKLIKPIMNIKRKIKCRQECKNMLMICIVILEINNFRVNKLQNKARGSLIDLKLLIGCIIMHRINL